MMEEKAQQRVEIENIADNAQVNITLKQKIFKGRERRGENQLYLIARHHQDKVGSLRKWLEICEAVYVLEAITRTSSLEEAAKMIDVSEVAIDFFETRGRRTLIEDKGGEE